MDYDAELARLSEQQLESMAQEPETAFPPDLWRALRGELIKRKLAPQVREFLSRSKLPLEKFGDVGGWAAVASVMTATPDTVYEVIGRVIATDELYQRFGLQGYPLDLQVSFPTDSTSSQILGHSGQELMWLRTVAATSEANHWVGRLLNTPTFFQLATKDDYVEFRADNRGLHFVRVLDRNKFNNAV